MITPGAGGVADDPTGPNFQPGPSMRRRTRVDEWLTWLADSGRSENTIRTYAQALSSLPSPATASREQVEAWWHQRAGHAPATRNLELAAARSFYRWMQRFEHRDDNPTSRIDLVPHRRGRPRPISERDLGRLLDCAPEPVMRAVALGAYAGLRVSEAARLDWSDIDVDRGVIFVRGKGGKERTVPLDDELLAYLRPEADGNVVRAGGAPYTPKTLSALVSNVAHALDIYATFHQLRHRFGTVIYRETGDLQLVADLMGHERIDTTTVYAAPDVADRSAIARAVRRRRA